MQALAAFLFFLLALPAVTQPTLKETQLWIAEKIGSHGYAEATVSNKYSVTYEEDWIVVQETTINSVFGERSCKYYIKLRDVGYISTTKYESTIWFNIVMRTMDNSTDWCGKMEDGICSLIFRKSTFEQDNLAERMRKAMSRLVELNGGKPLPAGETY